ncbi:conserved virulence factor C family protein [Marinicrinis sediminis]|uniref:Conserved virulence factor C family protein n=1 Tax=Marinicrinis sediminis TaxID=1652465 RepID=A0ABW5R5C2_9BACL
MKIVSIEPTPSPNTMKLNMDTTVDRARTYTPEYADKAPAYMQRILAIPDVKSVFQTADFIAVDRKPNRDWKAILNQIRAVFGEHDTDSHSASADDHFGEVKVYVQVFRKIPMQIRVKTELSEVRETLSPRFVEASMRAGMSSPNLIKERKLEDWGVRYGEPAEIAADVQAEIEASYDEARLHALEEQAKKVQPGEEIEIVLQDWSVEELLPIMDDPDWRRRYAAFEQMEPVPEMMPVIKKALHDDNVSIRRLAVVYLGEIKEYEGLLELLIDALRDASASVRRTAGDTLSDLGDPAATAAMCEALKDKNKLVRWRAARFLYEVGEDHALPALREAEDDPEFEVSLQVRMAIERMEGGEKAAGTVWQQMTRLRNEE